MTIIHFLTLFGLFIGIRDGMQYLVVLNDWKKIRYALSFLSVSLLIPLIYCMPGMWDHTVKTFSREVWSMGDSWAPYYAASACLGFEYGKRKLIRERIKVILGSDPHANWELLLNVRDRGRAKIKALNIAGCFGGIPALLLWVLGPAMTSGMFFASGKLGFPCHPVFLILTIWVAVKLDQNPTPIGLFDEVGKFKRQRSNEALEHQVREEEQEDLNLFPVGFATFESQKDYDKFLVVLNGNAPPKVELRKPK